MTTKDAYKILRDYRRRMIVNVREAIALMVILKFVKDKMKTKLETDCPICHGTGKRLK